MAADLTREQLAAEIERLDATLIATPYSSDNWDAAERDLVACLLEHAEEIAQALRDAARAEALVAQQAEDEGLWFEAQTAPEAYLQQELRKLHAAVEGKP